MTARQRCTCGLLEKFPLDARTSVIYEAESDRYFLRVTPDCVLQINFCPFCGGYEKVKDEKGRWSSFRGGPPCRCGQVKKQARVPGSTLSYDRRMNEYKMPTCILYYCPFCGGKMPKSKRSSFFTKPSRREEGGLLALVKGCRTVEEVVGRLGEPDFVTEGTGLSPEVQKIYAMTAYERQLTYVKRWKTLQAVISVKSDGTFDLSWGGTLKERKWLNRSWLRRLMLGDTVRVKKWGVVVAVLSIVVCAVAGLVYEFVANDGVRYFTEQPVRLLYIAGIAAGGGLGVVLYHVLSRRAQRQVRLLAWGVAASMLTVLLCYMLYQMFCLLCRTELLPWGIVVSGGRRWLLVPILSCAVMGAYSWFEFYRVWKTRTGD